MDIKVCCTCKVEKPLDQFNKNATSKDLHHWICRECCNKAHVKTILENKENNKNRTDKYDGNKVCGTCKTNKSKRDFSTNSNTKDGLESICQECSAVRKRKQKYGLSQDEYNNILISQGNRCAICQEILVTSVMEKRGRLSKNAACVDHNHVTEKVRGVLCGHCNFALGLLKDNITSAMNLVKYLEKHKE